MQPKATAPASIAQPNGSAICCRRRPLRTEERLMRKSAIRPYSRRKLLKTLGATAGVAITFLPRGPRAAEEKKLNVYSWDTYIGETTLDTFKEKTDIDVQYDLVASNEELFAKL